MAVGDDARDHGGRTPDGRALDAGELGAPLGERATLVQFSTAFCQPCRATRRVLADVAGMVPGVAHVEVDAERNLDLVRELLITATPTVLVLDAAGRVVRRGAGQPRRADVIAALGRALDVPTDTPAEPAGAPIRPSDTPAGSSDASAGTSAAPDAAQAGAGAAPAGPTTRVTGPAAQAGARADPATGPAVPDAAPADSHAGPADPADRP